MLTEFFDTAAGKGLLEKLQGGGSLSGADRGAIESFLIDKISSGQLKPGLQFVNGRLVYVRLVQ